MAYASISGRARTSSRNPRAFAVCQRCGIWNNRDQLTFQFAWRGAQLQNTYILVCNRCLDVPTEQLRAIVLPPDPVPIFYPSVEDFRTDETTYRAVTSPTVYDPVTGIPVAPNNLRVTEDCQNLAVSAPFGIPVGDEQDAVMPYNGAIQHAYGVLLPVLSVTSNGTATITVTCSAPHGLASTNQISADGLSNRQACGMFSITVVNATTFSYQTYNSIPTSALLTSTSRIVTSLAGLPLGFSTIPPRFFPPTQSGSSGGQPLLTDSGDGIHTDSGVQINTSG